MATDFIDILYQIVGFLIPVSLIILIFYLIRSTKKRSEQLRRIEKKIDVLESKVNSSSTNGSLLLFNGEHSCN
ncbi:hypothetical protein [Evansella clarkii]|uniref:hypothetical protein n=1 Tax=Evansella clarkii TaxID=79879 RepID=UPI000996A088|nr:hypothetical protein [Evansella clarkii]